MKFLAPPRLGCYGGPMKKLTLISTLFACLLWAADSRGETPKKWSKPEFVIKFGTLAPPGTAWTGVLNNIKKFFEEKTHGRAKFIFYMGGVMGDEPDMVRKMKINQLQGGGFTFQGVHSFFPELMVMELPFLFNDYGEVDYVFKKVYPDIARILEKKGFVLVSLGEEGFQVMFSVNPVKRPEDMKNQKCWVWEDEPVQIATYKALGVTDPIPTTAPELLPALQNGMVNLAYMSPMAVVGLQLYTKAKSILNMRFRYNPVLYITTKSFWDSLPRDIRDLTAESVKILKKESFGKARDGQDEALKAMQDYGLKVITPTPEELDAFKKRTRPVWDQLADKIYPRWLLDKVLRAKEEYRKSKGK